MGHTVGFPPVLHFPGCNYSFADSRHIFLFLQIYIACLLLNGNYGCMQLTFLTLVRSKMLKLETSVGSEMLECVLRSASRKASQVRPRLRRKDYTLTFVGEIILDNFKSIQMA